MILVLGGTTEGRTAVQTLEEAGSPYYYSTRGGEQDVTLVSGIRLQGAMDAPTMEAFCREHDVRLLVDAAHPFASELHRTVADVAQALALPAIRLERLYPDEEGMDVTWCADYADAIRRLRADGVRTLLCLTGVQTISRLRPLWTDLHADAEAEGRAGDLPPTCRCHFRILDRESSRQLALREGFPTDCLHYYHRGEDERRLMNALRPEAILTKESGLSGGFCQKVAAANELGIRVYAIRRPPLPTTFLTVNGPHGLRRLIEHLLPAFFPLHSGLTTGSLATAAALAATRSLVESTHDLLKNVVKKTLPSARPDPIPVTLPDGETIVVDVERLSAPTLSLQADGSRILAAQASVVKDASDDPDLTRGLSVCAHVAFTLRPEEAADDAPQPYSIEIKGGEGIGTVTLPGLGLPVGGPAINVVPQQMIRLNLTRLLTTSHAPRGTYTVTLSVPGGEEVARRTFNPRMGVVGGISIIGTSGIVKPFSSEAFVESIRRAMAVARATGSPRVVINSGARSEKALHALYPDLPLQAFVHYGNFIGQTLTIAAELGVARLTLGLMMGKAVKLAEGQLDTHSKRSTMNRTFIRSLAQEAGCSPQVQAQIPAISLARELWSLLNAEEKPAFCRVLIEHCRRYCAPLIPEGELTIVLVTDEGEVITAENGS